MQLVQRTYEEINQKIKQGKAVVVTAEEIIAIARVKGVDQTLAEVDVVTTATFGPMCSSGAFLSLGHSDPPIRMEKTKINDVPAYSGIAAVDTYIGATEISESEGSKYGGAHVICDLIAGKELEVIASGKGTDCYPAKEIVAKISLDTINEAFLFNPRNCYQNYGAVANTSDETLYTYMGVLHPNTSNIAYCTSGELSPLHNDPYYRTIGIGTRIFLAGAQGYVAWLGTQSRIAQPSNEHGVPVGPAATLSVIGDMRKMNTKYIKPVVIEGYGVSLAVGIGIPIPILDREMLEQVLITNKDIQTNIMDYGVGRRDRPVLATVNYEELFSGSVNINGKTIRTYTLSSLYKSRKIAAKLRDEIRSGSFFLEAPVEQFHTTGKSLNVLNTSYVK